MFIIHQQWKRCAQKVLPVWSCPLLSRFWPCVSTGRHCCAADLHAGLKAAGGLWETHEPAPVGLQKSSLSLTPFHQQRWNTNWFHLSPQRAQIKVCEAWLHRACTIHKWNPQRVSVISVRCKTIMTPFHHSTGCSSVIGGVTDNYQTHTDINIIDWAQLLI